MRTYRSKYGWYKNINEYKKGKVQYVNLSDINLPSFRVMLVKKSKQLNMRAQSLISGDKLFFRFIEDKREKK